MKHNIDLNHCSLQALFQLVASKKEVQLSKECEAKIKECRNFLDEVISTSSAPIYGINTGFGSLYKNSISGEHLEELQVNLVRSHACGMGEEVPQEVVSWMILLKILGLSKGHSGVQAETVQLLVEFYNRGILPVVYQQGSLGASGDLAPLAHLSLALFGEGEVHGDGAKLNSMEVLNKHQLKPITLKAKEGLALLNGTQFMSGYACYLLQKAHHLMEWADALAALSVDAYDGRKEPFQHNVNEIRKQIGQQTTAKKVRTWLEGSELIQQAKKHVQDPYSFRCVPQVHGASRDVIDYVSSIVEREINAVTDNPTIFPETGEIISAGNFHGQPLALSLDQLCIAMAEVGAISERRVYKLISGNRELPEFLVSNPGLNSGFMIPQYTCASIVSQNKQFCMPASVDSIDSSNGQEDHVSMGANAATKAFKVIENLEKILGIELMNAAQAIDFRRPAKTSPALERLLKAYRAEVPFVENDQYLSPLMHRSANFIREKKVEVFL